MSADSKNIPETVEQIALNNMVNIEALLDVLIDKGIIQEDDFQAAKTRIEARIIDAQREANGQA